MNSVSQRNTILALKKRFSPGIKIQLTSDINDPWSKSLRNGLKGIVSFVDDAGTIHVNWENGSTLGLAYPEDHDKIKVIVK